MKKIKSLLAIGFLVVILISCTAKSSCDKFLEGYENFGNKLIEIVNKMKDNPKDLTVISEYTKLLSEYAQWSQVSNDCSKDPEFMRKFADIQLRIDTKLMKNK